MVGREKSTVRSRWPRRCGAPVLVGELPCLAASTSAATWSSIEDLAHRCAPSKVAVRGRRRAGGAVEQRGGLAAGLLDRDLARRRPSTRIVRPRLPPVSAAWIVTPDAARPVADRLRVARADVELAELEHPRAAGEHRLEPARLAPARADATISAGTARSANLPGSAIGLAWTRAARCGPGRRRPRSGRSAPDRCTSPSPRATSSSPARLDTAISPMRTDPIATRRDPAA